MSDQSSDQPSPDQSSVEQFSDADFDVSEVGRPGGPADAAERVASFMVGEGPEKRAGGDTSPDPVLLERKVLSKGKPKAKRFVMSDPDEAQEYAELEHSAKTTGDVVIQKIRELVSGVDYALFITWIEYEKPEEVIREQEEHTLREKSASMLRKLQDHRDQELGKKTGSSVENAAVTDDGVRCMALTAKKKQCSSKRKEGEFCGRHQPEAPASVPMDAPPPSHDWN